MNIVTIVGNLGKNPELKYARSGMAVSVLSVATNESYTNKEEVREKQTEWHRVKVYDRQVENCARYLHKGSKCAVTGRLQTRKYEDKQGVTHYMTEIIASRIEFLEGKNTQDNTEQYENNADYNTDNIGSQEADSCPF